MTPETLHIRRKQAAALLEYACDNGTPYGRPERGDLVYDAVTEGRDCGKVYSSCADLAHWLWFRLGVRLPWLNREEHLGWRMRVNVSRITAHSGLYRGGELDAGDVVLIYDPNDPKNPRWHVVCIVAHAGDGVYGTAEYGQPGGKLKVRKILPGGWCGGGRKVQHVLRLEDILTQAEDAGLLVEPDLPEGVA